MPFWVAICCADLVIATEMSLCKCPHLVLGYASGEMLLKGTQSGALRAKSAVSGALASVGCLTGLPQSLACCLSCPLYRSQHGICRSL